MLKAMFISRLVVRDFRSYPQAQLCLQPGVTVLLGPNGAGKTNLVEALAYPAMVGSHRVSSDAVLVRHGAAHAVVQVVAVRQGRQASVDVLIGMGGRGAARSQARVNRNPVPRVRDVAGVFQVVMFAPTDVEMVRGDPAGRRRFLDEVATALTPRLAGVRADYEKAVRQRSVLLKTLAATTRGGKHGLTLEDEHTLQVWDQAVVRHGAVLMQARLQLVHQLNPLLDQAYAALTHASQAAQRCQAHYVPSGGDASPLLQSTVCLEQIEQVLQEQIVAARSQELQRGVCLVGPHRDELSLLLGSDPALPARTHASHGETWSVALALRVASAWLMRGEPSGSEGVAHSPIVILDDVLAELDVGRRERLAQILTDFEQVIITAADPGDLPPELEGRVIAVPQDVQMSASGEDEQAHSNAEGGAAVEEAPIVAGSS